MNNKSEKWSYYSPQFSEMSAVSVRRLAWALGIPMTSTVEYMVKNMPFIIDSKKVCDSCRDKTKCEPCVFRPLLTEQAEVSK
jgi:hypothetical protein